MKPVIRSTKICKTVIHITKQTDTLLCHGMAAEQFMAGLCVNSVTLSVFSKIKFIQFGDGNDYIYMVVRLFNGVCNIVILYTNLYYK